MTLEQITAEVLKSGGYKFNREYQAIPGRRFKFDFALLEHKILIEVQGGQFMPKSGHSSISGLERDYEKCNLAQIHGWTVLQYGDRFIREQPFDILEDIKQINKKENSVKNIVTQILNNNKFNKL